MKKIDTEKSKIYKYYLIEDQAECLLKYLGNEGYFSNDTDFENYVECVLWGIISRATNLDNKFVTKVNDGYNFFIPKDLLVFIDEQPTKKYRPFMYLDELPFRVGDTVTYRCKSCTSMSRAMVIGIEHQNNDDCELDNIIIGGINCTPQELFDHYELLGNDCQYKPFGVEE